MAKKLVHHFIDRVPEHILEEWNQKAREMEFKFRDRNQFEYFGHTAERIVANNIIKVAIKKKWQISV